MILHFSDGGSRRGKMGFVSDAVLMRALLQLCAGGSKKRLTLVAFGRTMELLLHDKSTERIFHGGTFS